MSNGFGPAWMPEWMRKLLTRFGVLFFQEASWDKHDEGYSRGDPSRWVCDRKFLEAMLRDARRAKTALKVGVGMGLAWSVWVLVRLFGWISYKRR